MAKSRDLEIIKQLEKQVGKKLEQMALEDIMPSTTIGYAIDENGNIIDLNLFDSKISDISLIRDLKNLTHLNLSFNHIADISPIQALKDITTLNLSYNQIADISPIQALKNLKRLTLKNNKITQLPIELVELGMEIKWEDDYKLGISLKGNPLETPPVEIVKQGTEAVRNYFKELEKAKQPLNEMKVLLVGDGGAGKTSLMKRLIGAGFDPQEPKTHGINIQDLSITADRKKIKTHLWDFGGQEIMHATHQFFLSKRSLYILVLDGRKDEKIEYWLKHIESFGGDSPVLVVLNKSDEHPSFDLDRKFLKEKYKGIRDFYRVSCKTKKGMEPFINGLHRYLVQVELLKTTWPKTWFSVKNHLEKKTANYISYPHFIDICQRLEVKESQNQQTLIEFLHDLGVVLYFKDFTLKDIGVLNPKWVTRAVYKIINAEILAQSKGILELDTLTEILDPKIYPQDKHNYIIELMKKFELCYTLDDCRVLVPQLLGNQQPDFEFNKENSLKFLLEYDFLPPSVMPRCIVKMHRSIDRHLRWRTGVVLKNDTYQARALVKTDEEARKMYIYVNGCQKRDFFSVIRDNIRTINESFEKINAVEKVPLPDNETIVLEYDELIGYEIAKRDELFVGKLGKPYSIQQLLGGIDTPEHRILEHGRVLKAQELHLHIEPKMTQIQQTKQEVKTDVDVDVDVNVAVDINLSVELPRFQDDFNELKELLTKLQPGSKESLKEIGDSLDSVSPGSEKEKLNTPMNKLRRFLNKLNDKDSDLHKILTTTKKGIEAARKVAKTYNKFAQWLGLPQVPKFLL